MAWILVVFLAFLLVLAVMALAIVSFYAFQFRAEAARFDAQLTGQQTRYDKLVDKTNQDTKQWLAHSAGLTAEIQRLARWRNIADADVKAAEMLKGARATWEKAMADANNLVASAQQRVVMMQAETNQKIATELANAKDAASTTLAEARQKAKQQKDEAEAILHSATVRAANIIEAADKKAKEIAGDAYEAKKNAAFYEQTAKAMKNLVEGYGDRYIVPEQSLLDRLADDFSHANAGQELKRARDYSGLMVQKQTAGACDYADAGRRENAVNFVVDAFNGKVDSILSRVKHDNVGKLEQQILDAFVLVNYNGKAFREARVREEYLKARVEELKWAAVVQQLSVREREEQREARERIREEARAAKEIERALKEANKEEEILRKAMLQAQEQIDQASGEQRAMYEARLQEMSERLREAEERKERARSMAQQTKNGTVYIISNVGSFGEHVFKIGLTRRWDPKDRVAELSGASVPFNFDVHALILSDDAPRLEHQLHAHFVLRQVNKANQRKEFFRVTLQEIRQEIEKLGFTTGVNWTMTAEAKEFRETLAIDQQIQSSTGERDRWMRRQLEMQQGLGTTPEFVGASVDDEE